MVDRVSCFTSSSNPYDDQPSFWSLGLWSGESGTLPFSRNPVGGLAYDLIDYEKENLVRELFGCQRLLTYHRLWGTKIWARRGHPLLASHGEAANAKD